MSRKSEHSSLCMHKFYRGRCSKYRRTKFSLHSLAWRGERYEQSCFILLSSHHWTPEIQSGSLIISKAFTVQLRSGNSCSLLHLQSNQSIQAEHNAMNKFNLLSYMTKENSRLSYLRRREHRTFEFYFENWLSIFINEHQISCQSILCCNIKNYKTAEYVLLPSTTFAPTNDASRFGCVGAVQSADLWGLCVELVSPCRRLLMNREFKSCSQEWPRSLKVTWRRPWVELPHICPHTKKD